MAPPDAPQGSILAVATGIERMRLRLLDLSSRNRLLNFRHTKRGALRVVDEVPDQLFSSLVDGSEFAVAPVPSPTRRSRSSLDESLFSEVEVASAAGNATDSVVAQASAMGIRTDFELLDVVEPDNPSHADRKIQALLFPEDLAATLRKIASASQLAEQETGTSMLHMVFGFLEWFESEASSTPRLAPLVLLPVTLRKGDLDTRTREFKYHVSGGDQDVATNVSLRERLKRDFSLELPELADGQSLSQYFEQVTALCSRDDRWRVRRFVSMTLLSFGKMLMYKDLASDGWPSGSGPTEHARVRELLGGIQRDSIEFAEDYNLDQPEIAARLPPIVDEADSSQHSALVDAMSGRNLVIEGPPGTGKSQTIANLIAASLSAGKTILFVSEKLAALEVVRHRLNKVGLGDFCLELHSHKSKKRQILDDLEQRLERQPRAPDMRRTEEQRRACESDKSRLLRYSALLHEPTGATGTTLHDALWTAERLRSSHPAACAAVEKDDFPRAARVTADDLFDYEQRAASYSAALADVSAVSATIAQHPWFGSANARLSFLDEQLVVEEVSLLGQAARRLKGVADEWKQIIGSDLRTTSYESVRGVTDGVSNLPQLNFDESSAVMSAVRGRGGPPRLVEYSKTHRRHALLAEELGSGLAKPLAATGENVDALNDASSTFNDRAWDGVSVGELGELVDSWSAHAGVLQHSASSLGEVADACSLTVGVSDALATVLGIAASLLREIPPSHLRLRSAALETEDVPAALLRLVNLSRAHRQNRERLSRSIDLDALPTKAEMRAHVSALASARWWSVLARPVRDAKRALRVVSLEPVRGGPAEQAKLARDLARYAESLEFWGSDDPARTLGGAGYRGPDTDFDALLAVAEWRVSCSRQLAPFGAIGSQVARLLWTATPDVLGMLGRQIDDGSDSREGGITSAAALGSDSRLAALLVRDVSAEWADRARDASAGAEILRGVLLVTSNAGLLPTVRVTGLRDIASRLGTLVEVASDLSAYSEIQAVRSSISVAEQAWTAMCAESIAAFDALASADVPVEVADWVIAGEYRSRTALIERMSAENRKVLDEFRGAAEAVETRLGVGTAPWFGSNEGPTLESEAARLAAACERAIEARASLVPWIDYVRSRDRLSLAGLPGLVSAAESGGVDSQAVVPAMQYQFWRTVVRAAFGASAELDAQVGLSRDDLRARFAQLDKALIDANRLTIAFAIASRATPRGVGVGRAADFTELHLLEREIQKQRKHIPVRQLMRRAGRAVQSLKPCFMMGPLSVAQFLEPGQLKFDVVVMDEASQLRPEDAMGAILRGSQLVVVGDRMQLPPTSFFDRIGEGDDAGAEDADSDLVSDVESILDICAATYKPVRMLRWHYRSRHANLIAFSNKEFYRGQLVAFPSPRPEDSALGVKFVHVTEGVYGGSVNLPEARRVVDTAVRLMYRSPRESLGIVAMNSAQREVIEELFERRLTSDALVRVYVENHASGLEPFFIKNLENVQGDERDVIYVSVTYGPDESRHVYQRFGPINGPTGHRRLNVLFTRARRRLVVFSSMTAEDVVAGADSNWGVRALKGYLHFARSGSLHQSQLTGRAPDSDFEIAVADALRRAGYDVVAQVGVAGFFLDLAVRDPRAPGTFLLGVECDGRTYHSSRSARDRDRLRQAILEDLGWRFHRIWSTDWFRRPQHELSRLIRRIEELLRADEVTVLPSSTIALEIEAATTVSMDTDLAHPRADRDNWAGETSEQPYSEEEARVALIAIRARIRSVAGNDGNEQELLREAMIEQLVRTRPISKEEFLGRVPFDLRLDTDGAEIRTYLSDVMGVLRKLPRR